MIDLSHPFLIIGFESESHAALLAPSVIHLAELEHTAQVWKRIFSYFYLILPIMGVSLSLLPFFCFSLSIATTPFSFMTIMSTRRFSLCFSVLYSFPVFLNAPLRWAQAVPISSTSLCHVFHFAELKLFSIPLFLFLFLFLFFLLSLFFICKKTFSFI